jgi:hypothetical protein
MKYSIVICYRNREEHLKILVPRLRQVFADEAEIILVEQYDNDKFQRGQLFNVGAKFAKGSILVFHDVDHYPLHDEATMGNVLYDPADSDVLLPVNKVIYVKNDLTEKPLEEIPSGYRHFRNGVDRNYFGGVIAFRRDAFFRINGFNSIYRGWGLEDADLRERIQYFNLQWKRGLGVFYALDHPDSNPGYYDEDFQKNNQIFLQWRSYLDAGVNTQHQTIDEIEPPISGIDKWLQVQNIFTVSQDGQQYTSVNALAEYYEDTPEKHSNIWNAFKQLVNSHDNLREHRNWVVANRHGYGNRAFHWMWNLIVKDLPRGFKFLEIGVYMGQTISLISLLNKAQRKNGLVFGITPLTNAGDKYSKHPNINYEEAIGRIYYQFGLDGNDLQLIEGMSNDKSVIAEAQRISPFDVIYVDGCHDYEVVKSDIQNYAPLLKLGGLFVMDDASCSLNIPDGLIRMNWRGLEDVCRAAAETIEQDSRFRHLFAVGHNRVWRRIAL